MTTDYNKGFEDAKKLAASLVLEDLARPVDRVLTRYEQAYNMGLHQTAESIMKIAPTITTEIIQ